MGSTVKRTMQQGATALARATGAFLAALVLAAASPAHGQDVPVTALYGSGTDRYDELGWSLALHDDLLLVGAPYDRYMDPPLDNLTGRVYAFRRAATGTWEEFDLWLPTRTFPDWSDGGGGFGNAVALAPDGRLAAVGARGTTYTDGMDCCQGAAYLFRYDDAEAAWVREGRVRDLDADDYAQLGTMVAVAGDLVATNGDWNGRGLVVYRHVPGADDGGDGPGGSGFGPWVEEATFTTGDVAGFLTLLGDRNVAVMDHPEEGERAIGGAYWEDTANGGDAGAVYVYRNDGSEGGPAAWGLEARIEPSDAAPGRAFGSDLALSADGRLLVVGAYEFCDQGRAYVYRREGDGAQSAWMEEAVLIPPALPDMICFGAAVSLSEEAETGETRTLIGSTRRGTLYRRAAGGGGAYAWEELLTFGDVFDARTPVLSGLVAAAGYPLDSTRGDRAGQALAFELAQAVPNELGPEAPSALALSVRPNPARESATVVLTLPSAGRVAVGLYDALGRAVVRVHGGVLGAGTHRLLADVSGLPAGVYLVRAEAEAGAVTARLAVVR